MAKRRAAVDRTSYAVSGDAFYAMERSGDLFRTIRRVDLKADDVKVLTASPYLLWPRVEVLRVVTGMGDPRVPGRTRRGRGGDAR